MNQGLLAALPGTTRDYHAVDKGVVMLFTVEFVLETLTNVAWMQTGVEPFKSNLQNHSSAPTVLSLKEGAQVILLKVRVLVCHCEQLTGDAELVDRAGTCERSERSGDRL